MKMKALVKSKAEPGIWLEDVPVPDIGINDVVGVLRRSGSVLLDGYGWRPLSAEWDYRKTMRRIYGELFPELVIHQVRSL